RQIHASFPVVVDETGARFSAFIKLTPLQKDGIVRMITSLHSFLNHNNELSEALFNSLVAYKKTKEHKTYNNTEYNYIVSEAQWFSTQSMPLSVATIWFFRTVTSFVKNTKNTEVGVILLESDIQYKEIAVELQPKITNDSIINRESETNSREDQIPEINNNSIVNRKRVSENNSKENQVPRIIEISSNEEDKISEIIGISSDEENQTPEDKQISKIIVLLSILKEQTSEIAIINSFRIY
ncbi:7815_t:CDS:2, partial [Dentiscutata heterogama]